MPHYRRRKGKFLKTFSQRERCRKWVPVTIRTDCKFETPQKGKMYIRVFGLRIVKGGCRRSTRIYMFV